MAAKRKPANLARLRHGRSHLPNRHARRAFDYGLVRLDFEIRLGAAVVILSSVLLTQFLCTRIWRLPKFDPKSALISGLSLCLLLRTNSLALLLATGFVTIASKFTLRWNGKHIFTPTNFGIVAMMLATDGKVRTAIGGVF